MNNELRFYIRRFVLIYYNFRYSQHYRLVTPIVVILIGLTVLVMFIFPQINNWFSVRSEVEATQARINIIRQNIRILENTNKEKVESEFIVASQALPSNKDFSGILDAINDATTKSGITLDDYEFSLGSVFTNKSGNKTPPDSSSVLLKLSIEGNSDSVSNFLSEIENEIPIVQLQSVNFADNKGQMQLSFPVKPFADINMRYDTPITVLTNDQRSLMQKLHEWNAD